MKPTVFNYQEYERVVEENKKLKAEVADLRIRCRIADGDKRDCNNCKHHKPDGCSRWDCEYKPRMVEVVLCTDCRYCEEQGGHANCDGYLYCTRQRTLVDESCFCSWGERREP